MKRAIRTLTVIFFNSIFLHYSAISQPNIPTPIADSLWSVWLNESLPDTSRLKAMQTYAWDGYLFTNADSAFYYAQLQYDFAEGLLTSNSNKRKEGLKYMSAALNTQGASYYIRGNYGRAIEYFRKCLKIKEEIGDRLGIASTTSNIGIIYKEQGDYERALEFLLQTLEIEKELKDERAVGNSLGNLGSVYHNQGKNEIALEYYMQSLEIMEKLDDKRGLAGTLNNIGVVYEDKGEYELALEYYLKSLKNREEIGDKRAIASSLNNIGNVYRDQGKYQKALEYSKKSLGISQQIGALSQIKFAAHSLWEINKKLGRFKESLQMYEVYITMRDSIESEENQKEVIRQEYKYEYEKQAALDSLAFAKEQALAKTTIEKQKAEAEKKDAEIRAKQSQIKIKRNQQLALFIGLTLVLIFAGFIYNRFRVTKQQKSVIEKQKSEVEFQKGVIEGAHKEITDSIRYAQRIQKAILPPMELVHEYLPKSFIFYKPKDVVAGDFYWLEKQGENLMFAAADCTGHGVPGAMVSVVCINGLNRSVREYGLTEPDQILNKTREIVIQEFRAGQQAGEKNDEEVKDGMDIALCVLTGNTLRYAGANNPLWIIRKDSKEVEVIKANKQPIGKYENPSPYTTNTVNLKQGDTIYIFSDGLVDQFGGGNLSANKTGGKKFKASRFKTLLLSIQNENMVKQKNLIEADFESWKGDFEQIDDLCVIGVRI